MKTTNVQEFPYSYHYLGMVLSNERNLAAEYQAKKH